MEIRPFEFVREIKVKPFGVDDARRAEIGEFRGVALAASAAIAQEHVLGFDVAVHDAVFVHVRESVHEVARPIPECVGTHARVAVVDARVAKDASFEVAAVGVLEDQRDGRGRGVVDDAEEGDDVGVGGGELLEDRDLGLVRGGAGRGGAGTRERAELGARAPLQNHRAGPLGDVQAEERGRGGALANLLHEDVPRFELPRTRAGRGAVAVAGRVRRLVGGVLRHERIGVARVVGVERDGRGDGGGDARERREWHSETIRGGPK